MLNFKPFNIHRFDKSHGAIPKRHYRGFTAHIRPAHEEHKVAVHVSFCSREDAFCRKDGYTSAMEKPPLVINARHLHRVLQEAEDRCAVEEMNDFTWVYRYLV